MNLIMLIGSGSTGKSTYAAKILIALAKVNKKFKLISMDNIIRENGKTSFDESFIPIYINKIQTAIDDNIDNIIIDFSQDSYICRELILSNLNLENKKINFYPTVIRPSFEKLIENQIKRQYPKPISDEQIKNMTKVYNGIKMPYKEEFDRYGFNSITINILNDEDLEIVKI